VLKFVDIFTVANCIPPTTSNLEGLKGDLIISSFSCVAESEKNRCIDGGGSCKITRDGYYIMNMLCIFVGVLTFWPYIKPAVQRLQALPVKAWRLTS
jgi:hypothetical protein